MVLLTPLTGKKEPSTNELLVLLFAKVGKKREKQF